MRIKRFFLGVIIIMIQQVALGQSNGQERLSIVLDRITVQESLIQLDKLSKYSLAYDPSIIPNNRKLYASLEDYTISEILNYLFQDTNLEFQFLDDQIIITKKPPNKKYNISGYVKDKETGENLAYATLYNPDSGYGTTANEHGYFSLTVEKGAVRLMISYVGRDELEKTFDISADQKVRILLANTQSLDEVLVTPNTIQGSAGVERSYRRSAIQNLALNTPAVSGESDVLQIVRTLPGVQSNAGEVGSFYVRGGDDDQNLVLMDGVPIYYPAHLLGIYSIFNAESVRDIQIFRGGFPARYGGRLSSVIDIRTKDGRTDGWHADLSGSYQSVRGAIQGPLFKGASIMVGGRKSLTSPYINDVIGAAFYRVGGSQIASNYEDFNFKVNFQIGEKGRLVFNGYTGKDAITLGSTDVSDDFDEEEEDDELFTGLSSSLSWTNSTYSINFRRELGLNSFLKASHIINDFSNDYEELLVFDEFTEIDDVGAYSYQGSFSSNSDRESKIQIDHYVNPDVTNRYGLGLVRHGFSASAQNFNEITNGEIDSTELNIDNLGLAQEETIDASHYYGFIEHERRISKKLFANIGLRVTGFMNEDEESFGHLEPRINLKYLANEKTSWHFSFSKMVQYIHQISDSNLSFPKDLWLPSVAEDLEPSKSIQVGFGAIHKFDNAMNLDVQFYYKQLRDIHFAFGITNFNGLTTGISNFLQTGSGENYGMEILSEIPLNKWFISNSFTLARATRQYDGINLNDPFAFQYDRRLEWKSMINYNASKNLNIGLRVLYGTGNPSYLVNPFQVRQFSYLNLSPFNPGIEALNEERAAGHWRVDLSATYGLKKGKFNHSLKANLYNVLNVRNSGFSYLNNLNNLSDRTRAFSIPFIPSIQYNLSF